MFEKMRVGSMREKNKSWRHEKKIRVGSRREKNKSWRHEKK